MKILLADDHELFRDGLRLVLSGLEGDLQVLQASSFPEALAIADDNPDIGLILMDLVMPGMPWSEGLQSLKKRLPEVPVVILSASDDRRQVLNAVKLGAHGYIPKTSSSKVMLSALRLVLSGGVYLPPALLEGDPTEVMEGEARGGEANVAPLTPRQREVLSLLGQGKSNKEIARLLDLSEGTVKLHVTAILKALNVSNRTGAVVVASRLGLSSIDNRESVPG